MSKRVNFVSLVVAMVIAILGGIAYHLITRTTPVAAGDQQTSSERASEQKQTTGGSIDAPQSTGSIASEASRSASIRGITNSVTSWDKAIYRARGESLQSAVHRAAVSRRLEDVAAAVIMQRRCLGFVSSPAQVGAMGVQLSPEQGARLQKLHDDCWQAQVQRASGIPVKNADGYSGNESDAVKLLAGGSFTSDDEQARLRAFEALRATGSAELVLAATFSMKNSDLVRYGFPVTDRVAESINRALLDTALRIIACTRGGYCEDAAAENFECRLTDSCMRSLTDLQDKITQAPADTVVSVQGFNLDMDKAARVARWNQMREVALRLVGPP